MFDIRPITIRQPDNGSRDIVGEYVTEHLAVTPTVLADGGGFTGAWTVTHVPTGYTVVTLQLCVYHARVAAERFAQSDIDWSQPMDALIGNPAAKDIATRIRDDLLYACDGDLVCSPSLQAVAP